MSAASFIGMAGSLYFGGYDGLAFVLGWTGGYVLVSILMAPYLRKFGQFTVPDFFSARYGGNLARGLAVIVLITASFTYVVAQIVGVGIITARFLDIGFEIACFVGLIGILMCSMLGGMKAVTWTQVAQYIILIIAYLIPVVVLSAKVTGVPIPQIMYGQALEKIAGFEKTFGCHAAVHRGLRRRQGQLQRNGDVELLRADPLPHGRHGVAAAHPDAVLHDAVGQAGARLGGLVAVLHLPALLHGAGLCGLRQAGSVPERDRSADRPASGMGRLLGQHRPGRRLRRGQRGRASSSCVPA